MPSFIWFYDNYNTGMPFYIKINITDSDEQISYNFGWNEYNKIFGCHIIFLHISEYFWISKKGPKKYLNIFGYPTVDRATI